MVDKLTYEELEQRLKDIEEESVELRKANKGLRRAEKLHRKLSRRLRTLLDFIPYPLVVFTLEGHVYYLNLAFTQLFGWSFEELEGKLIPFVPPDRKQEVLENIKKLFKEKILLRHETKRLTKDGRVLDVAIRASLYSESEDEPSGELVIFRNITQQKKIARINEAILRISMALPKYPTLDQLIYYINSEVKPLVGSEGSIVILRDEKKGDLFVLGPAYDDTETQKRVKKIRFSMDQLVAGEVIRTGEPIIVSDTSENTELHRERDKKLGYKTKNLLLVPLRNRDRVTGALCAVNKKEGIFDQADIELLNIVAGTVELSVENARVSDELKKAYNEVTSLNRAKDKVINHLSHELRTPVAILSGSLRLLMKELTALPEEKWKNNLGRIQRNLDRIVDIQYEVADIMQDEQYRTHGMLSLLLDQCTDELEVLIADEVGTSPVIEQIRRHIDNIFGPKNMISDEIFLNEYVRDRLGDLKTKFSWRQVQIITRLGQTPAIFIPLDPMQKVIDGLVKNAIENTPDEGKIDIIVQKKGAGSELVVHDYGVGITEENQKRIFEGFFATQDTMKYSSKKPFDFNAGGKGADLLRMKIFSERYNFKIAMESSRCRFIPKEADLCPGRISSCTFCAKTEDCHDSGGTVFSLYFPPVPQKG